MPTSPDAAVLAFLAAGDLTCFAWLAADAERAPGLEAREALSRAASEQTAHYDVLATMLSEAGGTREAVVPFLALLEEVGVRTSPSSWEERLLRTAVVGGMVRDLGEVLAGRLSPERRARALEGRGAPDGLILRLLGPVLAADEPLRARLSLWGRRVSGEALGVLPTVLAALGAAGYDESAELHAPMAAMSSRHARRMDELGLAA